MPSPVIKQAPREAAIVTIATAIDSARPGDEVALEVVRRAYRDAQAMREAAAREAERILEEGRRAVETQGRAAHDEALRRLEMMVRALESAIADVARHALPVLVNLVMDVADRIVRRELTTRPEAVLDMAVEAIQRLPGATEITCRMQPDDLAALEHLRVRLEEIAPGRLRLLADDRVDGGCLVEASTGMVDARLSSQLQEMRKALHDATSL